MSDESKMSQEELLLYCDRLKAENKKLKHERNNARGKSQRLEARLADWQQAWKKENAKVLDARELLELAVVPGIAYDEQHNWSERRDKWLGAMGDE